MKIDVGLECDCRNCEFGTTIPLWETKLVCSSHESEIFDYGEFIELGDIKQNLECWKPSLEFFINKIIPLVKEKEKLSEEIYNPNYDIKDLIRLLEKYYNLPVELKNYLKSGRGKNG